MLQSRLIERVLVDFGLTDLTSLKVTPAADILAPHKSSAPFEEHFNYCSVLGKVMYLSSNTRCELFLANHQCSGLSIDPCMPHGVAHKRFGRCLLGTRDKGMIIRPTKDLTLDCYVDADFAGLFTSSDPHDPKSVKSRSGFVITLGSIPVAWASKFKTETALSTMETEYISLSQALRRSASPPHHPDKVSISLSLKKDPHTAIKSTIFEDNQACLSLATSDPPKMTPRSKSRSEISLVLRTSRTWRYQRRSDRVRRATHRHFSKPLDPATFAYLREMLLGW